MTRRAVNITLDNLDDLPARCRQCVFWELDPVALDRAKEAGDTAFEKESWVSATLLDWGSCGKVVYVDGVPAGFVMYAPPGYVPRSIAFPTSPVSADAVLLMTGHVHPDFAGGGLGRMLLQSVAKDLTRRGVRAIEAFGDEKLVAAACVLPAGRRGRVPGLADSKLLTPAARERVYEEVVARAVSWSVVSIPVEELDARGMHVTNLEALRRAVMTLDPAPEYVLTDGFPVPGLGRPGLAVWKGDRVAACVAAASVLAKVTRDRMMLELHEKWPEYDFAVHKGYITDEHSAALDRHGPCPQHRMRFVNVARARDAHAARTVHLTGPAGMVDDGDMTPRPCAELSAAR